MAIQKVFSVHPVTDGLDGDVADATVIQHYALPAKVAMWRDMVRLGYLGKREGESPYPIHKVASILAARGFGPHSVNRYNAEFGLMQGRAEGLETFHPVYDAIATALCFMHLMPRGRFIAVEGIDGCGKSTLAVRLAEAVGGKILPRRMVDSAEKLKKLRAAGAPQCALQAAYLAGIAKVSTSYVVPGLVAGQQMVADRWVGGQLASGRLHSRLQGKANCSGGCALGKVGEIATPDIVFFLTAKDDVRRARMETREELSPNDEASLVEGAQDLYRTAIISTYPKVVEIDTTNLDQDAVLAEALKHL